MTKNSRQLLSVAVDVSISFGSSKQAQAAVKALIPDNVNMPKGLSLQMFSKGRDVFVEIKGNGVPMATIINTLDEVLEHLSVAKKVMA
jgi:hypothetical protein